MELVVAAAPPEEVLERSKIHDGVTCCSCLTCCDIQVYYVSTTGSMPSFSRFSQTNKHNGSAITRTPSCTDLHLPQHPNDYQPPRMQRTARRNRGEGASACQTQMLLLLRSFKHLSHKVLLL